MPISSLATCRGRLGEQLISAEARSSASSSPSETQTFKRLGMALRLKSPPGARGIPRRAKGRSEGPAAEVSPLPGTDESLIHRDGSRGHPVRSIRSVHPDHRGRTGWATCCQWSSEDQRVRQAVPSSVLVPNILLLTLMKGDEAVEAGEQSTDLALFLY